MTIESEEKEKKILPQPTRIPVPSFAKNHQRKRRVWNKQSGQNDEERIHKMDALNLELSESFKEDQFKQALQGGKHNGFIERGRLLDSLDLNTGFDAIQKTKQDTKSNFDRSMTHKRPTTYVPQKVEKVAEVKESDLRDSLDEDDWEKFNDRAAATGNAKHEEEEVKEEKVDSDDSELDRDEEDDTDWLRHSMQESMSNWKKEIEQLEHRVRNEKMGQGDSKLKVSQKPKITEVRDTDVHGSKKSIARVNVVDKQNNAKPTKQFNEPKKHIQKSDQPRKSPKPNQKNSKNKSNDFVPQQIPIDEYYKLLNERLNKNDEEDDKVTFGNKCKNDFWWEDIKHQFINSESESSTNLGNNNKQPVSSTSQVDDVTKRASLKNNFMDNNEDASLFNKFKKYKDNQPKAAPPQQAPKPPMAKRDVSRDKIRANEAAKLLAQQKKNVRFCSILTIQ